MEEMDPNPKDEMERVALGLLSQRKPVTVSVVTGGKSKTDRFQSEAILDAIGLDKMDGEDVIVMVNEQNVHHVITRSSASSCIDVEIVIHNGKMDKNMRKITLNLPMNSRMTEVRDTVNCIMQRETNMDGATSKLILSGKVVNNFHCLFGDYVLYHYYWNTKYSNRNHRRLVIDAFLVVETEGEACVEASIKPHNSICCIPDKKSCKKLPQYYYQNKRTNSYKGLAKNYKKLKFCIEHVPDVALPAFPEVALPANAARRVR